MHQLCRLLALTVVHTQLTHTHTHTHTLTQTLTHKHLHKHTHTRMLIITRLPQRGAAIIAARGASSAASAGGACIDHIHDWHKVYAHLAEVHGIT